LKIPGIREVNGVEHGIDEEGFLLSISDWPPGVAAGMPALEGIEPKPPRREVISFMRDYYFSYRVAPGDTRADPGIPQVS
jgi:sulfur relay (sulfurtransferase) DsrC/TusE family protein